METNIKDTITNILNNYNVILEKIQNTQNSFIDFPIYVINLKNDIYRRAYIKYITQKLGINYTLVVVNTISNETKDKLNPKTKLGIAGCFLSHMWCIKNAIENNYKHFLIFEDDIVFHKNFKTLFKQVNYEEYDMIQLGCCDFNLKKNIANMNINKQFTLYEPTDIALGAYGNIYNLNFAKLVYEEKINSFNEFDMPFDMYYNKYKMGVCLPNLVTAELSTTNLGHDFSPFKKKQTKLKFNGYFTKSCFVEFKYEDYYFIWIVFIEFCYNFYKENKKSIDNHQYQELIKTFSEKEVVENTNNQIISNVLLNNGLFYTDINAIFQILDTDKY